MGKARLTALGHLVDVAGLGVQLGSLLVLVSSKEP